MSFSVKLNNNINILVSTIVIIVLAKCVLIKQVNYSYMLVIALFPLITSALILKSINFIE